MVAIGKVFKQVKACSEILLKMKKSTAPFACPGTHMPLLADHLECFEGAKGERYLIVVNGDFSRRVDYPVFIDAEIASQYKMALDVKNNLPMKFSDRNPDGKAVHEPYKMIKVELGPGEGTLIQLK
jgi:hypothetical protein